MENKIREAAIQIVTTVENREDAQKIAAVLVGKRLAACVQIVGPILSVYRWKDNIENAQEWQCCIKTRDSLYDKVEAAVKAVHPYETPEIIAMPILHGSSEYLSWLLKETTDL